MQNFRQFEAGPDPFGHKFQILFKWMQTAISLRHADTVDVKFVLVDENGGRAEKTIALPHADLLRVAAEVGRKVDDPWCSRLGAMHLLRLVETGEDMDPFPYPRRSPPDGADASRPAGNTTGRPPCGQLPRPRATDRRAAKRWSFPYARRFHPPG